MGKRHRGWSLAPARLPDFASLPTWGALPANCGAVAEWSKALAWKVSIRQNRIEGSNPSRSASRLSADVRGHENNQDLATEKRGVLCADVH
jgi:hypothetical protein